MSNVLVSQLLFEVTLASYVTTTSFNRYPCPGIDWMSESESYMLHVNPQEATAECGQPEPKLFS